MINKKREEEVGRDIKKRIREKRDRKKERVRKNPIQVQRDRVVNDIQIDI